MKKNAIFFESNNITGKNIKRIRRKKNITQEELCARMQVMGFQISRSDISKLENGKKYISDFEVFGFAKALKVPILELFDKNDFVNGDGSK